MPKKHNKSGMQEYIPAGNGDPSGEYADDSGSNAHFTNFKKPESDTAVEEPTPEEKPDEQTESVTEEPTVDETETAEEPIEEPIQTRIGELSKKQIKVIGNHVLHRYDPNNELKTKSLIHELRYYSGSFGDLSGFSDEDLKNIADQLYNTERTDVPMYIKEGGKWKLTKNKGIMELAGVKTYTKDEMSQAIAQENIKLVEKSQTESDKKIQKIFTKSTVCFGKGYSKEDLDEIHTASQNLVNDFPELSEFVREIGDRNNLEKYINAVNSQKVFSEEEITAKMDKMRRMYVFGAPSDDVLRQEAIQSLQGKVKIGKAQNAYAYWQGGSRRMIFMGKMKDAKLSLQRDYKSNFHPTPDVIGVYYHEMGHGVDSMISEIYRDKIVRQPDYQKRREIESAYSQYASKINELFGKNYNDGYKKILNDEFKNRYGVMPDDMNVDDVLSKKGTLSWMALESIEKDLSEKGIRQYNISRYAKTNKAEFLAESFSAHYCKANNPLAEDVFNATMDFYKKLKEF